MLWIFAALSLLLAVFALISRSLWWMIGSAAIYAPFTLYLGMTPKFRYVPFFLIFFLLVGLAVWTGRQWLGWLFMSPVSLFTLYVAILVITQWSPVA